MRRPRRARAPSAPSAVHVRYRRGPSRLGQRHRDGCRRARADLHGHGCDPDRRLPGRPDVAGAGSREPGADLTCTASYPVPDDDLRLSAIDNTAVATGVASAGSVLSAPSTAHVVVNAPAAPAGMLAQTGLAGVAGELGAGLGILGFGIAGVLVARRRRAA